MKKYLIVFLLTTFFVSCQITETIHLNADGSGSVEIKKLRDEHSFMLLMGDKYSKEEKFRDTTFVFQGYIAKYNETFLKYTQAEQQLFQKYANVKVQIKESSFDKEFITTIVFPFTKLEEVPNLYNTEAYASDLKNNYALTAEKHFFDVQYSFDGTVFKRTLNVVDEAEIQKNKDQINMFKSKTNSIDLTQDYTLKYSFPRKIKSVSNSNAILSSDKKSLTLTFQLLECIQDPVSTNLEVILE